MYIIIIYTYKGMSPYKAVFGQDSKYNMNVCAGDTTTDRDAHCKMEGSEGSDVVDTLQDGTEVPYSGLFSRRLYFANSEAIQFLFAKSNFTNGDTEPRLLHINFQGLAVLSRNSRNINASKITRYTVS